MESLRRIARARSIDSSYSRRGAGLSVDVHLSIRDSKKALCLARFFSLLLCAVLAAGCETILRSRLKVDPRLSSGTLPAVLVGESIVLAEKGTRLLAAAAGMDQTIHVLLGTQSGDKLRYSVVRAGTLFDGEMPSAVLQSGEALDAVVDPNGALHAVVGKRHFELGAAGWREVEGPGCRRFVRGAPNATCLFELSAPDPRNKTRWDWFGFGGAGFGMIWPWPTQVTKLGIAERAPAGWVERGIVDRASNWDTVYADAVANQAGDVEVVYRRGRFQLGEDSQLRYERLNAPGREAAPAPTVRVEAVGPDDASWSLLGVSRGEWVSLVGPSGIDRVWGNPRIASDPEGRETLVLMVDHVGAVWMRRIIRGVPEPAHLLLDEKGSRRVRGLVTLGDGRLIALLEERRLGWWSNPPQPLRLVAYREGKWSAPIEVGATSAFDSSSLLAVGTDSVALTGVDPEGRPYLRLIRVMPDPGAMRGEAISSPNA